MSRIQGSRALYIIFKGLGCFWGVPRLFGDRSSYYHYKYPELRGSRNPHRSSQGEHGGALKALKALKGPKPLKPRSFEVPAYLHLLRPAPGRGVHRLVGRGPRAKGKKRGTGSLKTEAFERVGVCRLYEGFVGPFSRIFLRAEP